MKTDHARQRQAFENALQELRAGRHADAANLCEDALRFFPDDASTICLAAKAYLALRQFDHAERHASAATRRFPGFAAAHDVYGDLMLATGRVGRAIEAYEKTLSLEPARPATLAKIDRARQLADGAGGRRQADSQATNRFRG
ncbi:MAG: tetratricopeptide repeat protein [Woeseiaceae bacterium]|nr:tetratricopeptide repeat protein [Woeseiaceae bacterium]